MDILSSFASKFGEKPCWITVGGGDTLTYSELDRHSNRAAQLMLKAGIRAGDGIAIMSANSSAMLEVMWAARRIGVYYTPISVKLRHQEAEYILQDCGARLLFHGGEAAGVAFDGPRYILDRHDVAGSAPGYQVERDTFETYVELDTAPIGIDFVYSSGTTGRPKGVRRKLPSSGADETRVSDWIQSFSQHDARSVCLITAPLYHAAPLRFTMRSILHGGTVVALPKFDAETALRTIADFGVTHSLWVPTMFYRLLALPQKVRQAANMRSLRLVLHSGGPCSPSLKQRMIEWLGPVVWEYYAASEGNGATSISPSDALERPGSVGRAALGKIHIIGEDGTSLSPGAIGDVYFEGGPTFEYHNDPEKTAESRNALGWSTTGDIGYLDDAGFLYLCDRKAHTIISGGVNIYPAEIEHALLEHSAVADVVVFGIPNEEYGEEVKALVALNEGVVETPELAAELIALCKAKISPIKAPRSISFEKELPRLDSGKLPKAALIKQYSKFSADRPLEPGNRPVR